MPKIVEEDSVPIRPGYAWSYKIGFWTVGWKKYGFGGPCRLVSQVRSETVSPILLAEMDTEAGTIKRLINVPVTIRDRNNPDFSYRFLLFSLSAEQTLKMRGLSQVVFDLVRIDPSGEKVPIPLKVIYPVVPTVTRINVDDEGETSEFSYLPT